MVVEHTIFNTVYYKSDSPNFNPDLKCQIHGECSRDSCMSKPGGIRVDQIRAEDLARNREIGCKEFLSKQPTKETL